MKECHNHREMTSPVRMKTRMYKAKVSSLDVLWFVLPQEVWDAHLRVGLLTSNNFI